MLELIESTFTLIYAISLIYVLLDCDIKCKRNLYVIGLFTSIMLISGGIVWHYFGYAFFMRLYPLFIHIPSFIAFMFISKYKGIKLFFIILTAFVLSSPPITVGFLVASFFPFDANTPNLVIILLFPPTWFIIYKYLRPLFLYMLENTDKGWFGFCTIPLSYYALIYCTLMYNSSNLTDKSSLMIMIPSLMLVFSAYIIILQFFKQSKQQLILENEQTLLKVQVSAAQKHVGALQENQNKTTIYRHDMRHHLNLINAYLTEDNSTAAQKYIIDIEKMIVDSEVKNYCHNYSVNLILSAYLEKAKQEQIAIETQIDLPQKNIVSDMDLCIIFANAIENAINACKHIPSPDHRKLRVLSKIKNDKIFIQLTNSYIDPIIFSNNIPINTENGHGLGTKSIIAITEKYNGIYSFEVERGLFILRIIL